MPPQDDHRVYFHQHWFLLAMPVSEKDSKTALTLLRKFALQRRTKRTGWKSMVAKLRIGTAEATAGLRCHWRGVVLPVPGRLGEKAQYIAV